MRFARSEDIKTLDKLASEKYGIPVSELMENAGRAIYEEIKSAFSNNKFAVFCGKGNNGGDGFVVARLLSADGCDVKVYLACDESGISDTAKIAFDRLKSENVEILRVSDEVDSDVVIIDALLGISVSGAPRGNIKLAIDRIASMSNTVISVDIPSGLSADDGSVVGSVVKADYTYTLALDKVGLNTESGKALCGVKKVLDIGIPTEAFVELGFI
ncbi:MAG: NAD(P)H-hydrate epimerase [Clostridia bacterium]|nr:NAD(P)H-hydrate epimerase [Clostridia bacterium]